MTMLLTMKCAQCLSLSSAKVMSDHEADAAPAHFLGAAAEHARICPGSSMVWATSPAKLLGADLERWKRISKAIQGGRVP